MKNNYFYLTTACESLHSKQLTLVIFSINSIRQNKTFKQVKSLEGLIRCLIAIPSYQPPEAPPPPEEPPPNEPPPNPPKPPPRPRPLDDLGL